MDEANLIDAESINWRLIVYPVLAVLVIVVGGLGYYYYVQDQRLQLEGTARAALLQAKTPEELNKVADQYPTTTQATLALINAASISFTKHDYAGAIADYQRIVQNPATDPELLDSAQLGLASCQEANGKTADAASTYTQVGDRGAKSPFAPFAYLAAARIYEGKGDKDNERRILMEAASLDPDSQFVKEAQFKLKQLSPTESNPLSSALSGSLGAAPPQASTPPVQATAVSPK